MKQKAPRLGKNRVYSNMNEKKFTSTNIEDALEKVAQDLGEDAYVLKTEKKDGKVIVTASTSAPSPERKGNKKQTSTKETPNDKFKTLISEQKLDPTLFIGLPGCGKTTILYNFLLNRSDTNIHYIRDGENHLLANSNSAIVASLLECQFSYQPILASNISQSTPVIEANIFYNDYAKSNLYQKIFSNYTSFNIFYVIDSFENFEDKIFDDVTLRDANFHIIYNKKNHAKENYLNFGYMKYISALTNEVGGQFHIVTDKDEIISSLAHKEMDLK